MVRKRLYLSRQLGGNIIGGFVLWICGLLLTATIFSQCVLYVCLESLWSGPSNNRLETSEAAIVGQLNETTSLASSDSDIKQCLSEKCIYEVGHTLARAFPDRHHSEFCRRKTQHPSNPGKKQGLVLVKLPKCGSTTAASVITRILRRRQDCKEGNYYHWLASDLTKSWTRGGAKTEDSSFWVAPVREPAARQLSMVFFLYMSWNGLNATEEEIMNHLPHPELDKSEGQGGYLFHYANPDPFPMHTVWKSEQPTMVQNMELLVSAVKKLVHEYYDFFFVTERMDESITVFSLLTGFPLADLLYFTSGKISGNYWMTDTDFPGSPYRKRSCILLQESFRTPTIDSYLQSPEWFSEHYGEYLLYAAANRSLDMTIDRLGRATFEKHLREFRRLQQRVQNECATQVKLPCSADGTPQFFASNNNCYEFDIGCGFPCIDQIVKSEMT